VKIQTVIQFTYEWPDELDEQMVLGHPVKEAFEHCFNGETEPAEIDGVEILSHRLGDREVNLAGPLEELEEMKNAVRLSFHRDASVRRSALQLLECIAGPVPVK